MVYCKMITIDPLKLGVTNTIYIGFDQNLESG